MNDPELPVFIFAGLQSCSGDFCFESSNDKRNYASAVDACFGKGGYLASITDNSEFQVVKTL